MNALLQNLCESLCENRNALASRFKLEGYMMTAAAAGMLTLNGCNPDLDALDAAQAAYKEGTGVFSDFRGNLHMPVIAALCLAGDCAGRMAELREFHDAMKKIGTLAGEQRAMASIALAGRADASDAQLWAEKTHEVYRGMKKDHPFLTSSEDIPFAAMLAMQGEEASAILADAEDCYARLRGKFTAGDTLQSLSHVLALSPLPADEKCTRTEELFDALKHAGYRYGKSTELAVLGCLACAEGEISGLAQMVIDADEYLKHKKGFGDWSLGRRYRRMFAAMLAQAACGNPQEGANTAAAVSLTVTIAAEVAMLLATQAAVAASSASAS